MMDGLNLTNFHLYYVGVTCMHNVRHCFMFKQLYRQFGLTPFCKLGFKLYSKKDKKVHCKHVKCVT